jgi:macrodomain Ter protein organizer (MatP/YcbG family)
MTIKILKINMKNSTQHEQDLKWAVQFGRDPANLPAEFRTRETINSTTEKRIQDTVKLANNPKNVPSWFRDQMAAELKVSKPDTSEITKLKSDMGRLNSPEFEIKSSDKNKVFSISQQ